MAIISRRESKHKAEGFGRTEVGRKKKKSRGSHEEVGGAAEVLFFWLLLYSNDHLDKGMVEETALHSINWAFVVTELLMMYKGSSAALSWTMRALCL